MGGGRSGLAEYLAGWAPEPVVRTDQVSRWAVEAFAALLDQPSPLASGSGALPPMWHWFGFLEHRAQRELGTDGHPTDGGFLPPIPGRRRMFAGGRWWGYAPLPVAEPITCRSSVARVEVKAGRSGEMAFVTVRSELSVHGGLAAVEEQDIVYRSEPDEPAGRRPAPGGPATQPPPKQPSAAAETGPVAHELTLDTDPTVLFRFSALTYNAHRIHYDHPYATEVEGYPGLVVHGPLLALLALELPRRHLPDQPIAEFSYRLRRPAFAGTPVRAWATSPDSTGGIGLFAGAVGAPASLTGTAWPAPVGTG